LSRVNAAIAAYPFRSQSEKGYADMNIRNHHHPTFGEIDAIEQAARRMRSEYIAGLLARAARRLVRLVARAGARVAGKSRAPAVPARRAAVSGFR